MANNDHRNPELEEALLGAILIDTGALADVAAILQPQDFSILRNGVIFQAALDVVSRGAIPDYLTITEEVKNKGSGIDPAYISSLITETPTSLNAREYARDLLKLAKRRRIVAEYLEKANFYNNEDNPLPEEEVSRPRKTRWNISELLSTDFPDPTGPVSGIIPIGLTLLGGRPKRGKSWLMLQCAYSLSIGGKFLNHDLEKSRVLYYALEDTPRRLKDRLAKFNPDPSALIEFDRELKPLHLGGLEQVERAAEDCALIVIDTLGRAMPGKDFTKDGALFGDVMGRLQLIALNKNNSIVSILHTRKPNGNEHDPVDDILGATQGTGAAPDAILALYREQSKAAAQLLGRGRDFDDIDLTLEFDPLTCAWQLVGETGAVRISDDEAEILEVMPDLGKAKVSTIAQAIRKDRGNTSKRLASLWTKGKVRKEEIEGINYYYLPTQDTHTTQGTQDTQDTQAV